MSAPVLTIVVPTYNEAENVGRLVAELRSIHAGRDVEVLVVDDDSRDGTADVARQAGARAIVRTEERGLATAVVRGIQEAAGTFVLVMDADFQHPPEVTKRMLDRALADEADLVVGSRYVEGGSEGGFALHRRVMSGGAALLAKVALPPVRKHGVTDPMSGLFLVRRDRVDAAALRPTGYKILLEILGKSDLRKVSEVGYEFGTRAGGESKLGAAVMVQYLLHLAILGVGHPDNRRIAQFGLVGISGTFVNLGLLYLLTDALGLYYLVSAVFALETSIITNFLLNDVWTFHDRREGHRLHRLARYNAVSLFALVVNLTVLFVLTDLVGLHYLASEAIAIVVSFGANYAGNLHWTYGGDTRFHLRKTARRWLPWLPFALIVVSALGMYLDDIGRADEIYFDEHYYVSVAYQISNGVWEDPCWVNDDLDHRPLNFEHPPLAKLLIAWSVHSFDPDQGVFDGCRQPDGDAYATFTQSLRNDSEPLYWRLPSVLFGTATVAFAGLAAGRLFRSPGAAALAAGFTLMDGVVFTSSRMAILDIFATGFAMAALWAATYPTKRGMLSAAVLLGLSFASKFTALFVGLPVLLVALYCQRRAGTLTRRRFDATLLAIILMPIPVLLLSYLPWWILWIPEQGLAWTARHWMDIQVAAVGWGTSVQSGHAYASPPAQWFAMERPVFYYAMWNVGGAQGVNRYLYGVGNPVLWWSAAVAVIAILVTSIWEWVRTRSLSAAKIPLLVGTFLPALAYGGFLVLTRESFLFYMTIVVPMLAIALAGAAVHAWRHHPTWGRIGVAVLVLLVAGAFGLYYPVLFGSDLPVARFETLMDAVPWMRA